MRKYQQFSNKRSFTLIEIMVALIIAGVLATIGFPVYLNFVEDSKTQLCATNLEALKSAFDIYMVEHNVVPGDLGQLSPNAIDKAFAHALRTKGWNVRLASFIEKQKDRGYAFASLVQEIGQGNLHLLMCPSDRRRRTGDFVSYGINKDIASKTMDQYQDCPDNMVVIADSDYTTFSDVSQGGGEVRHKRFTGLVGFSPVCYANAVTKGGWVKKEGPRVQCTCSTLDEKLKHYNMREYNRQKKIIKKCWSRCLR